MNSTQNYSSPQNNDTNSSSELGQATPGFIKRQKFQQQFQSPTDNILSPCSKMLSDPVALMRQKPKLLSKAYANSAYLYEQQMKSKEQTQQQQPRNQSQENKEN